MYTLYGTAKTRAFRPIWMLEELGQPYDHVPAPPHGPQLADLTPSGKIPVLDVDGEVIHDSVAIMTFLADRHQDLTHPAGSVERGQQDALTHQIVDEIDAVIWTAARHSFVLPTEQRIPEIKPSLIWEFQRNIKRLETQMQGEWLMGDRFTLPDILLVHCMLWAQRAKFMPLPDAITDYVARAQKRPAFQATLTKP